MRAFQREAGAPLVFGDSGFRPGGRYLEVPCGRCRGCRLERSRQDAIRCVHESQMHRANAFITLTYSEEQLPAGLTLVKKDFQDFIKRLRRRLEPGRFRFFGCGEYGEEFSRPHYHACLFGVDFEDRVPWKTSPSGELVYRSALLESVWPMGHSSCGSVTFESAAYVARYVMKKELGTSSGPRRQFLDVVTGEVCERDHEFALRSLKPGLGFSWLQKYWSDVYPHGRVVMNGHECPAPRYYDKLFALRDPIEFAALQRRREEAALVRWDDNSPRRLRAKEIVLDAKLAHLKRSL